MLDHETPFLIVLVACSSWIAEFVQRGRSSYIELFVHDFMLAALPWLTLANCTRFVVTLMAVASN